MTYGKGLKESLLTIEGINHTKQEVKAQLSPSLPVKKYWMGSEPKECDNCHVPISDHFVDGKTVFGHWTNPWANLCLTCHMLIGRGFGVGLGQLYEKQESGEWLKTRG